MSRKSKHRRGRCCWACPRYGLALTSRRQVTCEMRGNENEACHRVRSVLAPSLKDPAARPPTTRHPLGLPAAGHGCPHGLGLLKALGQGVQETRGEALTDLALNKREEALEGVKVESNFNVPFRENLRNSGSWRPGPTKCVQKTWQGFNEAIGHNGKLPSTGGSGAHSSDNDLKLQKEGHKSRN